MVKFLIIGDLHGNKPKIHFKDFDAIIAHGDFCGTMKLSCVHDSRRKCD